MTEKEESKQDFKIKATTHFIQFHAETSFSDFVFGIRPDLKSKELKYAESLGVFTEALKLAKEKEKWLLFLGCYLFQNLATIFSQVKLQALQNFI